jgi:hypothetical protein
MLLQILEHIVLFAAPAITIEPHLDSLCELSGEPCKGCYICHPFEAWQGDLQLLMSHLCTYHNDLLDNQTGGTIGNKGSSS